MSPHKVTEMSGIATQLARRNGNVPQTMVESAPTLRSPAPPEWLATWHPGEILPATLAEIEASLILFEAATAPSEKMAVGRALARAVDLFGAPAGFEHKTDLYIALLRDIPEDLLAYGVWSAMRDGEFFPRPAAIREPIREELSRRLDIRLRLDTALRLARRAQDQRERIKQSA